MEIANLRARGCAMELAALEEVFTVMGHPARAVAAAVGALVDAGEAASNGWTLALAAESCVPPTTPQVPPMP